jgi:prevent-host-death family protein
MKFVSVAEAKNRLTVYLAQARKNKEPIIVTHHGKPYALIQPISEEEGLGWDQLTQSRLRKAWEGEDDALHNTYKKGHVNCGERSIFKPYRNQASARAGYLHGCLPP